MAMDHQLLPGPLPNEATAITFIVTENFRAWDFLGPRDRVVTKSTITISEFVAPGAHPISTHVGVPDSLDDGKCIAGTILRRSLAMPAWSDRLFVCLLMSDSEQEEFAGQGRFDMKFTVMYGTKEEVAKDEAVAWDLLGDGPVMEVLRACKPPIPRLRVVPEKKNCEIYFSFVPVKPF